MSRRFRFGKLDFGYDQIFCGAEVQQSLDHSRIEVKHEEYMHKAKPITVEKMRRAQGNDDCTPKEKHHYRALCGVMQWPTAQSSMHGAATVSLSQARTNQCKVQDLLELNKALRFMKNNADIPLRFAKVADGVYKKLRFGSYFDAAWAVRPDGTSQGGYLIFVISEDDMDQGTACLLVCLDYASKKLTRISRSSLACEAQSGANAVDMLEWTKIFWTLMTHPYMSPDDPATAVLYGKSPVITDARALYDAGKSRSAGLGISEKRTAIEVSIISERMQAIWAEWWWTNNTQMLADGLTKKASRQQFADALRRGTHALKFDPDLVAGKKQTSKMLQERSEELERAAEQHGTSSQVHDAYVHNSDRQQEESIEKGHGMATTQTAAVKKILAAVSAAHVTSAKAQSFAEEGTNDSSGIFFIQVMFTILIATLVAGIFFGKWLCGGGGKNKQLTYGHQQQRHQAVQHDSNIENMQQQQQRREQREASTQTLTPFNQPLQQNLQNNLLNQIRQLQQQVQNQRQQHQQIPSPIYVTTSGFGHRYHDNDQCYGLRNNAGLQDFTPCRICFPGHYNRG